MTAAIRFHPEAYSANGPRLMGRHAAGASFLRGFLAHSSASQFFVQVESAAHAQLFSAAAQAAGRAEPVHAFDNSGQGLLAQAGTLYHPDPAIGALAWQRAAHGHGAWSLCGITHSTSSATAMDGIADLLTAPVQPWDAVICTSTAVRDNLFRVLQAQGDYLRERLGAARLVLPQLPVIPLGIHAADFAYTPAQQAQARHALGVDADALVVLFVGRLSFHTKAHPVPMLLALQEAVRQTGRPAVLVECGWHASEAMREMHEAAQVVAPGIHIVRLDGRDASQRQRAWAGADVFCSAADNIQESFGLTPLEAMACGLPVVVSDWDGYRDTVRDGVDGIRIPTCMPQAGLGQELALRHALGIDSYDRYCGHASTFVAVDVQAMAQAFVRLFGSPDLRRSMGEAGRQRARERYDWSVIVPQYEALWAHLAQLRAQAPRPARLAHPWPARMDPFHAFAAYPTRTLQPATLLSLAHPDPATAIGRLAQHRQLAMVHFAQSLLPAQEEYESLLQGLGAGPRRAMDLVSALPPARQGLALRALAWLAKLGLVRIGA